MLKPDHILCVTVTLLLLTSWNSSETLHQRSQKVEPINVKVDDHSN